MYKDGQILIGKSNDKNIYLNLKTANRHGLIAGATGTGKTTTLRVLAESFSDAGVPVFLADVKGDLAAMYQAGEQTDRISERISSLNISAEDFSFRGFPVNFWDVYSALGMPEDIASKNKYTTASLPLHTTVSEVGPIILARMLSLNDTQSQILKVVFKIADDEGILLIDSKDLKAMLNYVGDNAKEYSAEYGNIAKQSINTIMRAIIALEEEGADIFFSEPAIDINDWLTKDYNDKGYIQILDCTKLILNPTMYSSFMLWFISELYENMPEVGDTAKPRIVFFFDEAHILFDNAPKALLEKFEQVVKLSRSKGIGIYFITQSPQDISEGILSQLGMKIQHALHAYTPAELKKVKQVAETYRTNEAFDTYETLTSLGIGEALVSVLDENGIPSIVEKTVILPPQSKEGSVEETERMNVTKSSPLFRRYSDYIDRDSAYEFFQRKNAQLAEEAEACEKAKQEEKEALRAEKEAEKEAEKAEREAERAQRAAEREAERAAAKAAKEAEKAQTQNAKAAQKAVKSVASTTAGTIGRQIGKSVGSSMGGSFGKTLGGNIGASLGRGILSTLFRK